jgi:hypothetical protein
MVVIQSISKVSNDTIYGLKRMVMFNQLASLKKASESILADQVEECPYKLRRWMSQQCSYFSMKYSTSKSDATIKYGKILTSAHEAKL